MACNPANVQAAKILDDWCRAVCAVEAETPRGRMTMLKIAALIGVSKVQLFQWRRGKWKPKPEYWARIERLSGGRVPASIWKPPAKKRARVKPLKVAA